MISLFPSVTETLVLPVDSAEVASRLRSAISAGLLNGMIDGNRFLLRPRQIRPHPFAPALTGVIESSSRGSLVFLRYQLLPGMRASLLFWFFVVMAASMGAAYQSGNWWLLCVGAAMSLFARWIALSNQRLHIATVRNGLMEHLSP